MTLTPKELEIKERCEKAIVIVCKLCSEGRYPKMTIPVQEDDEDQILIKALNANVELLSTISTLREEKRQLSMVLDQAIEAGGLGIYTERHPIIPPNERFTWINRGLDAWSRKAEEMPELAEYLRKRSEAKQAEQTATQPASTNQEGVSPGAKQL